MESIAHLLKDARKASKDIQTTSNEVRSAILATLANILATEKTTILSENKKDLDRMDDDNPKKDRLLLNEERIQGLITSLNDIEQLEDPTGIIQREVTLDNGLNIQKVAVAMGVVGAIYESRPNVTIDIAALAIKSGNAVVLRGGSDAEYSNKVLVDCVHKALTQHNLPTTVVTLLPIDRKFVKEMLEAEREIDIIIPRGSQNLIQFVRENSKVPTIETGAGVCHTYVCKDADLKKAADIVVNAKVQRPSVCNSLDTILVDKEVAAEFLPTICEGLAEYDVEVFADNTAYDIFKAADYKNLQKAEGEDFGREFLDYKCSVKVISSFEEAINHIDQFSSRHSEAIITEDSQLAEAFIKIVDAAAVYQNASTRFTDGGVFGLGAEIGISTQKLHARGPFALDKLTTEKWVVRGNGQIRN